MNEIPRVGFALSLLSEHKAFGLHFDTWIYRTGTFIRNFQADALLSDLQGSDSFISRCFSRGFLND